MLDSCLFFQLISASLNDFHINMYNQYPMFDCLEDLPYDLMSPHHDCSRHQQEIKRHFTHLNITPYVAP